MKMIFSFYLFFYLFTGLSINASNFVYLLKVDGGINPASEDYIKNGLKKASDDGASLVIIKLNTPGGLLTSTRNIVQDMLGSKVPTVVYVYPQGAQAGSAGVMITLASNIAAMAPATNIGAAHPVAATGKEVEKTMGQKIEQDTIAFVKSIAELRNRNIEWAELAVKESASITSTEALDKKVIDIIANDIGDLLKQLNNREISNFDDKTRVVRLNMENINIKEIKMNLMQKIIMLLSEPNIAYMLMMAGMLGLYVEFTNPGLIFPGVAGAVCLLLSFVSLQTLPINIGALLLIILGIAFLIAEIFVTSFGILSIGGVISLFLGSIFLIDSSLTDASISRTIIVPTILMVSAFILFVGAMLLKARRLPTATGKESMIGRVVIVEQDLNPVGKIYTDASLWNAESEDGAFVGNGDEVVITKIEGLKLFVRKK